MRLLLVSAIALAAGCATVAKLDVTYDDAGAPDGATGPADASVSEASAPDVTAPPDAARADASAPDVAQPDGAAQDAGDDAGCPCDTTQALGCCVPTGAASPFCTSDGAACVAAGGAFALCSGYDTSTDSVCCWNTATGAGGAAQLSGTCGTRATACTTSADCNGAPCATADCKGVVLGACGATAPVCP